MEIVSTRRESTALAASNPVFEKLTLAESKTVMLAIPSANNPKLAVADLIDVAQMISNIVNVRQGLNPRAVKDEEVFLQIIEKDLRKFPQLTQNEALEILDQGLDGLLTNDEKIFFTSSLYVRWINIYIEKKRKPAMEKHSYFLHKTPDAVITQCEEERISTAAKIANVYADRRRKDPEDRVDAGSGLFKNLEELGIYQLEIAEKQSILDEVLASMKTLSDDNIKTVCQEIAYNRFIDKLVIESLIVTETGELKPVEKV